MSKPARKPSLSTILQLLFAGALVAFLFHRGDLRASEVVDLFRGEARSYVALAALMFIATNVLGGLRLHYYFCRIGHDFGLGAFVKLNWVGFLMGQVLPGVTAGDVVRGYFLAHHLKGNSLPGLVTMVWDRIMGLVTLLVIGAVPAIAVAVNVYGLVHTWPLVLVSIVLPVSVLWVARDPEKISRIVRTLEIWLPVPATLRVKHNRVRHLLKALLTDFKLNGFCFLLSLLIHTCNIGALLLLARALGDRTPILYQAILIPIVILAGIVPATPGNVGWSEWVSNVAWTVFGASGVGAQVFFASRIVSLLVGLPALYWVVRSPMHRARMSDDAIPSIAGAEAAASEEEEPALRAS